MGFRRGWAWGLGFIGLGVQGLGFSVMVTSIFCIVGTCRERAWSCTLGDQMTLISRGPIPLYYGSLNGSI